MAPHPDEAVGLKHPVEPLFSALPTPERINYVPQLSSATLAGRLTQSTLTLDQPRGQFSHLNISDFDAIWLVVAHSNGGCSQGVGGQAGFTLCEMGGRLEGRSRYGGEWGCGRRAVWQDGVEPCPCSPHLLTHGATLSHPELHCPTEDGGHPSPRRPPPEGLLSHTEGQPGTLPRRPTQPPAPGPPCWQRYPLLPEDKVLQPPAARPGPLPVSSQAGVGVSCWHPEGWGGTQNPWGSFQLAACILGSTSAKGTRGRGQRGWSEFSCFLGQRAPLLPYRPRGQPLPIQAEWVPAHLPPFWASPTDVLCWGVWSIHTHSQVRTQAPKATQLGNVAAGMGVTAGLDSKLCLSFRAVPCPLPGPGSQGARLTRTRAGVSGPGHPHPHAGSPVQSEVPGDE